MFGNNPIRHQGFVKEGLLIKKIFYTIQGEGPHAGRPAVFVRLIGCNLRCYYCDTDFETSPRQMSVKEVADEITRLTPKKLHGLPQRPLIVLTGGEPLLQQNIAPLIRLMTRGSLTYHVQIETNGTVWLPQLDDLGPNELSIVVSPKTGKINPAIRNRAPAFKYIIEAGGVAFKSDGLPIRSTQTRRDGGTVRLARPNVGAEVYVQPCDCGDPSFNKLNAKETLVVAMEHGYRVSFQMHKHLGVE